MSQTQKSKNSDRGQRHSAAWGKRLGMVALLLVAETAFGQVEDARTTVTKYAPDLAAVVSQAQQNGETSQTVNVIVQYKASPKLAQVNKLQGMGANVYSTLKVVNSVATAIPISALPALEKEANVLSLNLDHPLQAADDISDIATGVTTAWNDGYNGSGIGVAVIDSGINDTNKDLWNSAETSTRVVYRQDFTGTSNTNSSGGKYDLYGHGTHVAGILGGNGYLSSGAYEGVAPKVNLLDLRVLDLNGAGTDSNVIAAIQEAISLKSKYNVKVINLSLGRGIAVGYAQDPLCQAVESAWKAGIVVVVAAGNYGRLSVNGSNGYGTITAPGNDPYVITVGALNNNGSSSPSAETMTSYTSKGPTTYDHVVKPDLVAPGNLTVSLSATGATLEAEYPSALVTGNDNKNDYFTLSGTSMATPMVTGAVALMLQQNSALTPDQVKARLMKTAYKSFPTSTSAYVPQLNQTFTEYYDLFSVGAGLLNMSSAISNTNLASSTVGAALSPYVVYNPSSGTTSLVYGNGTVASTSVVWGSSVVWGTSVVWGANVAGSSVVWGANVPWNDNALTAFSVVWGSSTGTGTQATSVVWGAAAQSGDNGEVFVSGDQQ